MYCIKNKIESINLIKKLELNRFPEELFHYYQEENIIDFIINYPAKYYAVRDKSNKTSKFYLKVEKEDILNVCKEFEKFTVNVSSYNYADNQLLVGEILLDIEFNGQLIVSDKKGASVRDAYVKPNIVFNFNIDNKINKITGLDAVIEYICIHELFDVIVEFALFDIPVGINNEKIIIYELRTHY